MINRLIKTGCLELLTSSDDTIFEYVCNGINAKWLQVCGEDGTLGLLVNPPDSAVWHLQATLLLAASKEGWECGLECRDSHWILWRRYSNEFDDECLLNTLRMHLAVVRYLEEKLIAKSKERVRRYWGPKI